MGCGNFLSPPSLRRLKMREWQATFDIGDINGIKNMIKYNLKEQSITLYECETIFNNIKYSKNRRHNFKASLRGAF